MSESYPITIMGQKFLLKGSYDNSYIERVETYINEKIDEAKKIGGSPDSYNLMILVALNLVDECLKKQEEINKLMKNVEVNSTRLINLIDSHL
jgi:cell division protein ZapA (FtsZ GTPase activity inhibitor)